MINQTPSFGPVGEIEIGDKWIGTEPTWLRRRDGSWEQTPVDQLLPAADVLNAIEAHRATGAKALLVTLGMCGGGNIAGSLEIMAALRRFSAEVGPVIAHVNGIIGSTGPFIAVAADFVVMAERAKMIFHAATCGKEPSPEFTRILAPVLASRSGASEEVALEWLSRGLPGSDQPVTIGDTTACLAAGLADAVGALEQARILAHAVASGLDLPTTERGELLRQRTPVAIPVVPLAVTNVLRTTNFASTGSGASEVATAGAKIQNDPAGSAIVTCKDGMKVGSRTLEQMFAMMAATNVVTATLPHNNLLAVAERTTDGRLCMVGGLGNSAWSDTGGRTWTSQATGAGALEAIVYDPTLGFVVTGTGGKVYSSADGVTWTNRSGTLPAGFYSGVAVKNGATCTVVITKRDAASTVVYQNTVTGGTWGTWTARTVQSGVYHGVVYDNGLFIAHGYGNSGTSPQYQPIISTSADGITWTTRALGAASAYAGQDVAEVIWVPEQSKWLALAGPVGGFTFVGRVWTSPDAVTWTCYEGGTNGISDWSDFGPRGLLWTGRIFVMPGSVGGGVSADQVQTSIDGINWERYDTGTSINMMGAIFVKGQSGLNGLTRSRRVVYVGQPRGGITTDPAVALSMILLP